MLYRFFSISHSPLRLNSALLVIGHGAQVISLVKAGRLLDADRPDLFSARVFEGTPLRNGHDMSIDLENQVSVGIQYFP